jgi:hypothetical protein
MSPEEARRQARLEMEGTDHVKEAARDVRRGAGSRGAAGHPLRRPDPRGHRPSRSSPSSPSRSPSAG